MKRGDFVTVAMQGDFGKPRPALVVQSDALAALQSVVVCPLTSDASGLGAVRVAIQPSEANGLRRVSYVMVDKVMVVLREKTGAAFGSASAAEMGEVDKALMLVLGLS